MSVNEHDTVDVVQSILPDQIPEILIELGLAIIVFIIGWYLSKLVVQLAARTVARRIERPSLTRTALRGVRMSVLLVTLVIIAGILGVGGTEILLSVTVISAIIAIVLAPIVGSFINGIFILTDRPYEIGDMIEVTDEGHRGFVEDITIRYTKIFTLENTYIVIPNSEIHTRDVINYSAADERTRVSVQFEITYESDLESARTAAERATRSVDSVIAGGPNIRIGSARYTAAPTCDIIEYADHGVILQVRFWVKQPYKLTLARSAVQERIRNSYAELDVEFAYPHTHHVFDATSGTAQVAISNSDGIDGSSHPAVDTNRSADTKAVPDTTDTTGRDE